MSSIYIISTFTHSAYLELAISELELKGIKREKILAVPLNKPPEKRKIMDSINQSDGVSLVDAALILGTIFMVLGVIYGFSLKWGPIIWGLIGLICGGILGFIIDIIPKKGMRNKNKVPKDSTEVIIIINCEENQAEMVESILFSNLALGTGRYNKN